MIIFHACFMIIAHACTMIMMHACITIILHACIMIIIHDVLWLWYMHLLSSQYLMCYHHHSIAMWGQVAKYRVHGSWYRSVGSWYFTVCFCCFLNFTFWRMPWCKVWLDKEERTNQKNSGWTSVDRSTKATLSTYNTWIQLGRLQKIYHFHCPKWCFTAAAVISSSSLNAIGPILILVMWQW